MTAYTIVRCRVYINKAVCLEFPFYENDAQTDKR